MPKKKFQQIMGSEGNLESFKIPVVDAAELFSPTFISMINSMADHVFCKDLNGVYIACSQNFARFHGLQVEDVLGKTEWDLFGEERARIFVEDDHEIIRTETDHKNVDWNHYPNGNFLMETFKSPLRDSNGMIIGVIGVSRDITKRYEQEVSINAQMAEIENFFSVSNDLMIVAEPGGKIIKVNTAWTRILGYEAPDLVGKFFCDLIHPEDVQLSRDAIAILLSSNTEVEFINRLSTVDGDWKNFEWRGQVYNSKMYLASRDITKRILDREFQHRQQKLLEYRHRFEETLTSISTRLINLPIDQIDGEINGVLRQIGELIEVDRSYVFFFNNQEKTMTNTHEWVSQGTTPEIKNLADLPQSIFPWWMEKLNKFEIINVPSVADLPAEANTEREALESQKVRSILAIPLISDKALIGFLGFDAVKQARVWSADDILLIKIVSDIISNALMRQKYQKELSQSEERKSALLKAVPDLILRISRSGQIIDFKPSKRDIVDREVAKFVGLPIDNIFGNNQLEEILSYIEKAVETKELQTFEFPYTKGDSRWVMESRIQYSGKNEVTAIVRDVSERARLEQIKSDFINKATHELRTPIATMLLMANLMDGAKTDQERLEFWEILKSELDREKLLIDDILTAGKMENEQLNLHYKMVDIRSLFNSIFVKTDIQAREKGLGFIHTITRDEGVTFDKIQSDETALNQIFGNLIGNALKFTPSGGEVTVNANLTTSGLTVIVQDTGIGVPPEDVPFLFSRFFRGTNAVQHEIQGTGIGLFIVKSLLDRIGGKIQVKTKIGKGTKFIVSLPRTQ